MQHDRKKVTIHTDGGCDGNPGPGGWAAVLRYGKHLREVSGGEPATTNNRMELSAAVGALEALKEPCEIELFTDSEYLRKGITEWIPLWKRRGWRTIDKQPVRNQDLWQRLDAATVPHEIHWHWVKGHAGHADNERCDALAANAIAAIRKQFSTTQLANARAEFQKTRHLVPGENLLC